MSLILHVGGIYMTEALTAYEVVEYRGDNNGFCFLARPVRWTAPFRPLNLKETPMQWFTIDGYWGGRGTSELDLAFCVGERKDYPCATC
jgi:hypothetical protein